MKNKKIKGQNLRGEVKPRKRTGSEMVVWGLELTDKGGTCFQT